MYTLAYIYLNTSTKYKPIGMHVSKIVKSYRHIKSKVNFIIHGDDVKLSNFITPMPYGMASYTIEQPAYENVCYRNCIPLSSIISHWWHRALWLWLFPVPPLTTKLASWVGLGFVVLGIITMTSEWPRWRLKSPASPLFTQPCIQAQINENIKAPRHWPLCGEFTGDRWIPRINGQ